MTIEIIKRKITPILRRHGVTRAAIFGSFARGEEKKQSDVDILVNLTKDKTLLDLVGLKLDLEKKLVRKVDIITYNSIHRLLRERILVNRS